MCVGGLHHLGTNKVQLVLLYIPRNNFRIPHATLTLILILILILTLTITNPNPYPNSNPNPNPKVGRVRGVFWSYAHTTDVTELNSEKVYLRSQILERASIGEYWNNFSVPVLPENVTFTFFRTCWCYSEAYNTGT